MSKPIPNDDIPDFVIKTFRLPLIQIIDEETKEKKLDYDGSVDHNQFLQGDPQEVDVSEMKRENDPVGIRLFIQNESRKIAEFNQMQLKMASLDKSENKTALKKVLCKA